MTTKEIKVRWKNYRKANSEKPHARENEFKKIFSLVAPERCMKIWEVGTGNGYLALPLAKAVGKNGEIITTDVDAGSIKEAIKKSKRKNLNIKVILLSPKKPFLSGKKYENLFDVVTSLATLHHFDRRGTGDHGRKKALKYFYRNLKKGGRLVIGDVLHGTISQKYFHSIDDPKHCFPLGHPHNFFKKKELVKAVKNAGFENVKVKIAYVPWRFSSVKEAKNFIHTIHNARCAKEESFSIAKKYLGFKKVGSHYELGWELFFLTAKK